MNRRGHVFLALLLLLVIGMLVSGAERAHSADPAYMSEPWIRLGGPPGGIGYDVRMRPDNPDIMYVTASPGGIFKSTNGGQSWFSVTADIEKSPGYGADIFCATIDPHDYNTVWVGTQFIAHIYRSTDEGITWEQRDNGIVTNYEESVRGITIDPLDPKVLYAGVEVALYPGAPTMLHVKGKVYKTTDAGLNWSVIWEGDNLARYIWVDPRNTQRIYVSTGIFDRSAANRTDIHPGGVGVLRSVDGGQSWDTLDYNNHLYGLYIPSLFMHPTDPDVFFAAATQEQCAPGTGGGYLSRDGGTTWDMVWPEPFAEAVEIASSDTDVWYVAGRNQIARSDDAGKNWQMSQMETPDRTAGFPIDLQVDPRDPYRIFVNNYKGGNMLSTDGGETWTDASQGYTGAQVYALAVDPHASVTVYTVGKEGSSRTDDGGVTWVGRKSYPGWIFFRERDSVAEIVRIGDGSSSICRSTDGGTTWDSTLVVEVGQMVNGKALAIAPSDPDIFYIGYAEGGCLDMDFPVCGDIPQPGFFRSSDGGYTWEHVANTPFKDQSILSLAVPPDDPHTVFVATMIGPFVTRDGGDTWEFLVSLDEMAGWSRPKPGIFVPSIWVIVVDPFNSQLVYAGSPKAGVFRSTNGGQSWEQAAAGLDPNAHITGLVADMSRPGVLYASERMEGVFVSTDWAQTWRTINEGLNRPEVLGVALSADGTVLYAGTNGGGVFRLGTPHEDVDIDLKPGSCPNPLNTRGRGVLPVAILGTEDFNVRTIDRGSILLEGVPPLRAHLEDVSAPVDDPQGCDCTEDGPDRITDLSLKFDSEEITAVLGEVNPGDEVVLTLTGKLTDGTPIEGADCVVIVPVRAGKQSGAIAHGHPGVFALGQNHPNPFSGSTIIHYELPESGRSTLRVYDVAGRVVRILIDGHEEAGSYSITWDGRDEEGKDVSGGIYFYCLEANGETGEGDGRRASGFVDMKKMVVLR